MDNGIYTIQNTEKGTHRTVKIFTVKKGPLKGKRLVSLMIGSDNVNDYQCFGFVSNEEIYVWKRYRQNPVKFFLAKVISIWANAGQKPEKINILLSKRCLRCNRVLTTPESIERGIGPECAGKM